MLLRALACAQSHSPTNIGCAPRPHYFVFQMCRCALSFLGISAEVKDFVNRFNSVNLEQVTGIHGTKLRTAVPNTCPTCRV
jgi:hypothetical protein